MSKQWLDLDQTVLDREKPGLDPERQQRVGLAFSGGGIRSACFNLGILQALDEKGVFPRVDYLSTVSGGGYLGSWLVSCLRELPGFHPSQETQELDHLRQYGRYLAPESGFFSADTWTMMMIWLRNTTLLQAMLCCFLGCVLLQPRTWHLAFTGSLGHSNLLAPALFLVAVVTIFVQLGSVIRGKSAGTSQTLAQWWIVIPSLFACGLLAANLWNNLRNLPVHTGLNHPVTIAAVIGAASMIAALLSWDQQRLKQNPVNVSVGGVAIGAACGAFFYGLLHLILFLLASWQKPGCDDYGVWYAAVWGGPLLTASLTAVVVLAIGLAGRSMPDANREWWSRLGAWLGIYSVASILLGVAGIFGPVLIFKLYVWLQGWWATAGGATAVIATLTGLFFGKNADTGKEGGSGWKEALAALAPYAFLVSLVLGLSILLHWGFIAKDCVECGTLRIEARTCTVNCASGYPETTRNQTSLALVSGVRWPTPQQYVTFHWSILTYGSTQKLFGLPMVCVFFASLAGLTLILAWRVDLNEFSMNHFYRNRLVRCFMGAARSTEGARSGIRKPNRFTGFDFLDDYPIFSLRKDDPQCPYRGPLPIVNTALNLTGGQNSVVEERRATSFFFTPYSVGSSQTGFLDSKGYGDIGEGFKLGAAIATSGAAASPNMGYHTSAPISFLLTFFNVRLGWWVPNPKKPGGVRLGLLNLLNELFGTANDDDRYIYLSDGGHFENLGVYELIRRKCKWIVAGDGEQDNDYVFEGLGGLVRKCWTDLGVKITVDDAHKIRRSQGREFRLDQFAIGTITYRDGSEGRILYLKSSLSGQEPADVLQYYYQNKNFPHESTDDQFFSESQFESYRKLGQFIARKALDHQGVAEGITIAQAIIATQ